MLLGTKSTKWGSQSERVFIMRSQWHTAVEHFKLLTIRFRQEAILGKVNFSEDWNKLYKVHLVFHHCVLLGTFNLFSKLTVFAFLHSVPIARLLDHENVEYPEKQLEPLQQCIPEPLALGDLSAHILCGQDASGTFEKARASRNPNRPKPQPTLKRMKEILKELDEIFSCYPQGCFDMMVHFLYHHSSIYNRYFKKQRLAIAPAGQRISLEVSCELLSIQTQGHAHTVWCQWNWFSDVSDACNSGASSDIREPISLHQAVHIHTCTHTNTQTYIKHTDSLSVTHTMHTSEYVRKLILNFCCITLADHTMPSAIDRRGHFVMCVDDTMPSAIDRGHFVMYVDVFLVFSFVDMISNQPILFFTNRCRALFFNCAVIVNILDVYVGIWSLVWFLYN